MRDILRRVAHNHLDSMTQLGIEPFGDLCMGKGLFNSNGASRVRRISDLEGAVERVFIAAWLCPVRIRTLHFFVGVSLLQLNWLRLSNDDLLASNASLV